MQADVEVSAYADSPATAESGSERENLPNELEEGVTYSDFAVRWRVAARLQDPEPTGPGPDLGAGYESFLLRRLACPLAWRTSSLALSTRSAAFSTYFATFLRSKLPGVRARGTGKPSTRGRRARWAAALAASPSAAAPASAPTAPFTTVPRLSPDFAEGLCPDFAEGLCPDFAEGLCPDFAEGLCAVDPVGRLRLGPPDERPLGVDFDAELFRLELDAGLVAAALEFLELLRELLRRLVEPEELRLGLPEVATGPSVDRGTRSRYPAVRHR